MRQGISLAELAELHAGGAPGRLEEREGAHFLAVEEVPVAAELATVQMAAVSALSLGARVFTLVGSQDPWIHLGRAPDADIQLDDPAVSKSHLRFRHDPFVTSVTDEGSQNGTILNGVPLTPGASVTLRDGDVLEISRRYRATVIDSKTLLARLAEIAAERPLAPGESTATSRGLLPGKVAVITGAGRGLGRAYALRFAEEGCRVVVNDLGAPPYGPGTDASVAAAVVAEIERAGGIALASAHDVSSAAEVDALFALAEQRFGGVDILVCSAGVLHVGAGLVDTDDEVWDHLMAVNARGTFLCMRAAARSMIARGRPGRIITTSSMVALTGNAGLGSYAASKAAIHALSRTAALELAAHGIAVNTITPMAWTRLTENVPAIAAIPDAEHVLSTSHVADVVVYLASDLSAGVTGQIIDVGGPQLSFYAIRQSEPVLPTGARWTPQELGRRWREITGA